MSEYLEIIELRTTGQNREKLERTLEQLKTALNAGAGQGHIRVYNSLAIEGDFCIHLHVPSENSHSEGSPLGLRMVSILKEYGLVHHNIWREMPFRAVKGKGHLDHHTKE